MLAFRAGGRYLRERMASPPRLPPKKDVALALLEQSAIYVHLDPRDDAVRVPAWFKRQPQLVLQIGLNMPLPIPDLRVEDDGISCTLSFSRTPHFCWIPWGSVFALVGDNGRGMVWPDDVPKEVAAQAAQAQKPTPERPKLRAVAEKEKAEPREAASSEAAAEKPARKKRVRKTKKVEARPKPKMAPAPAAAAAKAPVPAPARKKTPEPSVAAAPPVPAARAGAGDKRRRALPPYLRVIK